MKIISLLLLLIGCYQKDNLETKIGNVEKIQTMYQDYKKDFPQIEEIQAKDIEGEYTYIDVRTPSEIAISTIEGSITKENFESNMETYQNKKLIVFCTIGYRSGVYTEELLEEGFDAKNLIGGVLMWAHEGRKFVDPEGRPTKKVHVYGNEWDLLPNGYISEY